MMNLMQISEILKSNDNFVFLTHQHPDGDTLGSAFALCRALQIMNKKAKVLCNDDISEKYIYMYRCVKEQDFEEEFVISVDVADTQLFGEKLSCYEGRVDLCIDHHESNTNFAKQSFIDSTAAATAEIVADIIKNLGVTIDLKIAECIYTGISTDTGCFKYSNTTPRTHRLAAEMLEKGARHAYINKLMFDTKSRSRVKLDKMVLDTLEFFCGDKCALVYVTKAMKDSLGIKEEDIEGIASIPRKIQGVYVGVTLREKEENLFKVSLRTNEIINASSVCKKFGGGGHPAAAGCTIKGELNSVKLKIVNAVCNEMKKIR